MDEDEDDAGNGEVDCASSTIDEEELIKQKPEFAS